MILTRIIPLFSEAGIPFCIVGGYAVAIHGVVRGTLDLDIITELTEENLTKIEILLESIGMQSSLPINASTVFKEREKLIESKNLIAWNFHHLNKRMHILDILITEDIRNYSTILMDSHWGKLPVIDLEGLIHIKSKSSREQDKEDIKSLKSLQKFTPVKIPTKPTSEDDLK